MTGLHSSTTEPPRASTPAAPAEVRESPNRNGRPAWTDALRPDPALLAPAAVVALAFVLRVWSVNHGLPYVYNVDEELHYVPPATRVLGGTFHPESFINPPALTYFFSALFFVVYGGAGAALDAWNAHPDELYLAARLAVACIGTVGVWLVYLTGSRLFGRVAGVVAAAAMAVAFLPVFYSHHALNDVPAMTAATLSLFGAASILRHGRWFDYALAGAAAGLAAATKYPSGLILVSVLAATAVRAYDSPRRRSVLPGLALALGCTAVAFLLAHPFALLDFDSMRRDLEFLSRVNGGHFIGLPYENGYTYYPRVFTWGLGWVPALAALAGAVLLARREPRAAIVLVPTALVYFFFVAGYAPYGRYLLPTFPIACLLAGYCARELVALARRRGALFARLAAVGAVAAATAQGLLYSIHNDVVLSRTDTRELARGWLTANVPAGATIVLEPALPHGWVPTVAGGGDRWRNYPTSEAYREITGEAEITPRGKRRRGPLARSTYVLHLRPEFIDLYRRDGACWIVSASLQSGRAFAEPERAPGAIAYYDRLEREADVVFGASPFDSGAAPVAFSYDFSFDYYPLAYHRPGPQMTVYRLSGGRCS